METLSFKFPRSQFCCLNQGADEQGCGGFLTGEQMKADVVMVFLPKIYRLFACVELFLGAFFEIDAICKD